eukprot:TRINITY_DN21956_c0_g1_i1.p1 TRINITY_DN21956_c0_g1~~TRINITY_DN21956_c0_g1_i1.p1  ORF type:complete len:463 (+),score=56.12 TRINITY_DN21956_c0_g1_i1:37-1425(+)
MQCVSCGQGGLTGKFCTECGTRLPERRMTANRSSASSSRDVYQQQRVPSKRTSLANMPVGLSKPMTAKGSAIRGAMDDLADEVFDNGSSPVQPGDLASAQNRPCTARTYRAPVTCTAHGRGYECGPSNEAGDLFDTSDRNILCMDVQGDEVVVGGADHGLKVYNLKRKRETRTLYTKRYGHSDWVTSCQYLSDGRIVSGGQDGKLCLWARAGVRCTDLMGHTASISEVKCNDNDVIISSSYDRTLRIWSTAGLTGTLAGHKQPVMDFIWQHSTLVSGDRGGGVMAWDPESEACLGVLQAGTNTRRGQCSALGMADTAGGDNVVMAGDQSGSLRVWDLRQGPEAIFDSVLHPGGALTAITPTSMSSHIITAGADKRILVIDPRTLSPIHTITSHKDFIYSVETIANKIVSGDGMGWVLVHNADTGKCNYGLGSNKAAVRCIHPEPSRLVVSGDDGSMTSYDMS